MEEENPSRCFHVSPSAVPYLLQPRNAAATATMGVSFDPCLLAQSRCATLSRDAPRVSMSRLRCRCRGDGGCFLGIGNAFFPASRPPARSSARRQKHQEACSRTCDRVARALSRTYRVSKQTPGSTRHRGRTTCTLHEPQNLRNPPHCY